MTALSENLGAIQHLLRSIQGTDSCVMTAQNDILCATADQGETLGTLPIAIANSLKYFSLHKGDIIILNDPFCGGTTLNRLVAVTILQTKGTPIYYAESFFIDSFYSPKNKIDEEGLRIPPTPLQNKFSINNIILNAIATHPLSTPQFEQKVKQILHIVNHKVLLWESLMNHMNILWKDTLINHYLNASEKHMHYLIQEGAHGEVQKEIELQPDELLRTRIKIDSQNVIMNFSGTSSGKSTFLSEDSTYGLCLKALFSFYKNNLFNSGTYRCLQIIKPVGCLLNSKYPSPMSRGIFSAATQLQGLIQNMIQQIHSHKKDVPFYKTPHSILNLEHKFQKKTWTFPKSFHLSHPFSIQEIENDFSIMIEKMGPQFQSDPPLQIKTHGLQDVNITWNS